jgi:hypothetical protein
MNEVGGTCSECGKSKEFSKPQSRVHLGHLSLHGRTKLKWIIEKYIMEIGTELNCPLVASSGRLL